MNRPVVAALLLALCPGGLFAQFPPYAPRGMANNNARARRALRERAAAHLGTNAGRAFVEAPYGDEACAAVFHCSLGVARHLAEFYAAGELDRLSRPREMLGVIAQCGDDAALFAIHHARELKDPDCMDAFLASPLEIALGLKSLAVAGSEYRAWRMTSVRQPLLSTRDPAPILVFAGILALIALFIWRKRRAAPPGL